jgi:hypothetical protein
VRSKSFLAAASLTAALVVGCVERTPPADQQSQRPARTERKTTNLAPEIARQVRAAASEYLAVFQEQNFDAMWAMIASESKKHIGIANFVRQSNYTSSGAILSSRVESVEGLEEGRALVTSVLEFRYHPTLFAGHTSEPASVRWEDEWVLEDGQWRRVMPVPDPTAMREAEELCANAAKAAQERSQP